MSQLFPYTTPFRSGGIYRRPLSLTVGEMGDEGPPTPTTCLSSRGAAGAGRTGRGSRRLRVAEPPKRFVVGRPNSFRRRADAVAVVVIAGQPVEDRSEEHTSELQSLMRISYGV